MSEHPELREAPIDVRSIACELADYFVTPDFRANPDSNEWAINWVEEKLTERLAGPVGKLQARTDALIEANLRLIAQREQLADPERIRREAIGARALDIAAKARPEQLRGQRQSNVWAAGYNHALDTVLAAGESAVTGDGGQ